MSWNRCWAAPDIGYMVEIGYGGNTCIEGNVVKNLGIHEIYRSFQEQMATSQGNEYMGCRLSSSQYII